VAALREAMEQHGRPEIFNTDQGVQFTSADFLAGLEAQAVRISMDGKGRYLDNIFIERLWRSLKYEDVVCCERVVPVLRRRGALPEMGVGPPKSACRGRLQTATSCEGKEPWW